MTNLTTGGFIGELAEAFAPPTTGGCCGATATSATETDQTAATDCCGSEAAAQEVAQAGCCGQAPAVAGGQATDTASAGCCG